MFNGLTKLQVIVSNLCEKQKSKENKCAHARHRGHVKQVECQKRYLRTPILTCVCVFVLLFHLSPKLGTTALHFCTLKGHRQPKVFVGMQAIGAIFCITENGADSLHADIATAPMSYRRVIVVDRSFFTITIGTIHWDI